MFQHRVDMRQTGPWTIAHGNGHGTIQMYNRAKCRFRFIMESN